MAKSPSTAELDKAQDAANFAFSALTPKQRAYCEARLAGMIPARAAKAAGVAVPEVNAYRMEQHPKIQRALVSARRMITEKFEISREDVLRGMFDAVQASGNATELVAAWREIGRIIGAYDSVKVEVMHKLEDVTMDKLQRLSTKDLIDLAEGLDFVVERDADPFPDEYAQMYAAIQRPKRSAAEPEVLSDESDDRGGGDGGDDSVDGVEYDGDDEYNDPGDPGEFAGYEGEDGDKIDATDV